MGQRRHHGEQAFECYLRRRGIAFLSVNEARQSLIGSAPGSDDGIALKSFDYVVYGSRGNLLVEVKCRRLGLGQGAARTPCWVTREDVESLGVWEALFGPQFSACLVFLYWSDVTPPGKPEEAAFKCGGRWYSHRAVPVREYAALMRVRSPRWRTVHLPAAAFDRVSGPLVGDGRVSVCAPSGTRGVGDETRATDKDGRDVVRLPPLRPEPVEWNRPPDAANRGAPFSVSQPGIGSFA